MKYPPQTITTDKKGNKELRTLIDKGKFCRYCYTDPDTGRILEDGKFSIIIKNERGKEEHFYMIPIKDRYLAIPIKETKKRKIWDKGNKKAINPV